MRIHPVESDARKFWKAMPIRIAGTTTCNKCNEPTVLVQSMKGGYVTQNCVHCSFSSQTLTPSEFQRLNLWVACPECKSRMTAQTLPDKNYGFACA
jgi:ssDNA-binding Zn-finger/Zn-ribbon topoisomerase 1